MAKDERNHQNDNHKRRQSAADLHGQSLLSRLSKGSRCRVAAIAATPKTKTDVANRPETFDHVGLLVNEPPPHRGLLFVQSSDCFIGRAATHRRRDSRTIGIIFTCAGKAIGRFSFSWGEGKWAEETGWKPIPRGGRNQSLHAENHKVLTDILDSPFCSVCRLTNRHSFFAAVQWGFEVCGTQKPVESGSAWSCGSEVVG